MAKHQKVGKIANENVVHPLSNESVLKKKNNLLKTVVGASVLTTGLMMAPQSAFAQEANPEPVAIMATENGHLEISEEQVVEAQQAGQAATDEINYAEDEKNIDHYRSTQMEQGNGPVNESDQPSMDFKDGFRYKTGEPGDESPDKTLWGFMIEFDKEKGERTYTGFYFTNSGLFGGLLDPRSIPANDVGKEFLGAETTYKAKTELDITSSGRQRNLNLFFTEEDLKYINAVNTQDPIIMTWEGHYTKEDPKGPRATQGDSATFSFTVNPWPNENDQLTLLQLSGSHSQKEFVKGQTITTGVKIENLDANARERLVGQVYHPETGEVVQGAKAYIDENDHVVVELPKGAVDDKGNINKDSIFYKDPKYKALQNLEVKFFARPRTADEFRAISVEANWGEDGYTSTGAGTAIIKHKGEEVVIDKQGIARYDHYNLIGGFSLNLDDTKYHDQTYTSKGVRTDSQSALNLRPNETLSVDNTGSRDYMDGLVHDKNAHAQIDTQFVNKNNAGKDAIDQWKVEYNEELSEIKVTAPKYAKPGDYVAFPITYTYTNGSIDKHIFFFVVQDDGHKIPDYYTQVGFPQDEQTSEPHLSKEEKDQDKLDPKLYTIEEKEAYEDDHGNLWDVSIDAKTGIVTAKPRAKQTFVGGEKLVVPIIAHYNEEEDPEKQITESTKAEFVIQEKANITPRYNAKIGKAGEPLVSDVIVDEADIYNRAPGKYTLKEGATYKDDKGNVWNVSIDEKTGEITATVPNIREGAKLDGVLLNVPVIAHYYEDGDFEIATKAVEAQFLASGTNNTIEHKEKIPFDTKIEINDELEKGQWRYKKVDNVEQKGQPGEKTTIYTIENSKVVEKSEDIKDPVAAIIEIGGKDFEGEKTIEQDNSVPR